MADEEIRVRANVSRGINRIVRCAKKGNRCRGWLATASWRGKTGEIPKAEIPELDNTNGTINVAFRNDVRRQLSAAIYTAVSHRKL